MSGTPQFVYFAQAHSLVKIGLSSNPKLRLQALRTACPYPIRVLRVVDGGRGVAEGREAERVYHETFAAQHAHGEWFHVSPELLSFVAELESAAGFV